MYILNKDELVPILRTHLQDYLVSQGVVDSHKRKFKCFVHDDSDPSMQFDPKRNDEVVHCFSCHADLDIFGAAEALEGLPQNGPEWMTHTIPALAKRFDIPVTMGDPSPEEAEKIKLYQIAQDVSDILLSPENLTTAYPKRRGWINDSIQFGKVDEETLMAKLVERGHNSAMVRSSMILSSGGVKWFGPNFVTTPVKDFRGRTVAFISRNIKDVGPKYINSCETPIFKKGHTLLGLDTALKMAKTHGLYIVEGMGDLAQLRRLGITNSVAVAGTSFTADHLLLLKSLGIRNLYFALDWDEAGTTATSRIFSEVLRHGPGVNCSVVLGPESGETDPDEYLKDKNDAAAFRGLATLTAFEWTMAKLPAATQPVDVCLRMIPIIAAESLTVRRDVLIQQLSEFTGIHYQSIVADVNSIRDNKYEERRDRLKTAGMKYLRALESDPDSASALLGQHEDDLRRIEQDYEKDIIGPAYQLMKYETVEDMKRPDADGNSRTHFVFKVFTAFSAAMSKGMQSTSGVLVYFPGRQNSGKTASMIALATDVLLHDDDAIVVFHFTDDNYDAVQPRIKTNIHNMIRSTMDRVMPIDQASDPYDKITDNAGWAAYNTTDQKFRELLQEEKLVIIDSEEGDTLSALERQLAYLRRKHPQRKMLLVCDNTHNYQDGNGGESLQRFTSIANRQKAITRKYKCAMWASAEYRKNMPKKLEELKLPVDDDILGAGAFAYRASIVVHVYNDLNDRSSHAEAYWTSADEPDVPKPRLQLIFSKNKVSSFKTSLALDLDPRSVTVMPVDIEQAVAESAAHRAGGYRIKGNMLYADAEDYDGNTEERPL